MRRLKRHLRRPEMDSDDEMMVNFLLEEEADIDDKEDENLLVLTCLAQLLAEDEANSEPKRGGSKFGRRKTKPRMIMEGHFMLFAGYFADEPRFDAKDFRRRFQMSRRLFNTFVQNVREHDSWFKMKKDAVGMVDFSSIQKCTSAMRMIEYGAPTDGQDDYLRMSESLAIKAMYRFCTAIVEVFGPNYLRGPNEEETARILATNEAKGFPGMLGSIDCMQWSWKTVHLDSKDCTKGAIKEFATWSLRQWQTTRLGFGMRFSAWQDLTMTSMCCSVPLCSRNLLKVMLRQ